MARVLVEQTEPAAAELSTWLAARGHEVVVVEPSLLAYQEVPWLPDVAYLDVWTPETAPRVAWLRAEGVHLSCLADLLLAESRVPVIGITGTAGKSTAAAFLAAILDKAGTGVVGDPTATGQRWPGAEQLVLLPDVSLRAGSATDSVAVLELTSSHLAFCHATPAVAVVTTFWPDHIELHGSLEAYRDAKRRILAPPGSLQPVVVNADDPGAMALVAEVEADRLWSFSASRPVERGAHVQRNEIVVSDGWTHAVRGSIAGLTPTELLGVLAAVTATAAWGLQPGALTVPEPPFTLSHRAQVVGSVSSTLLIDDSLAATPTKAAATLSRFPASSVVAVVGGELAVAGLLVHGSDDEHRRLMAAFDVLGEVAAHVVAFGAAGPMVHAALTERGIRAEVVADLGTAVRRARELATQFGGASNLLEALVVAPMFPIAAHERVGVAGLLRGAI